MDQVRLTEMVRSGGCAAKMAPDVLSRILKNVPTKYDENLIVGYDTSDDAAVYQVNGSLAIVQTLDFFPPVVDDPYLYGQIAATNALSDIYAMGGTPKTAMNISCFPNDMSENTLNSILRGGADKVDEAGAIIVGGHTIDDVELKYGLSVTGFVHPNEVLVNCNAKPGDSLILTKAIGTGILNLAYKADLIGIDIYENALESMKTLNKYAQEVMLKVGVNSCTDITGFGLLGHGAEMAEGSGVTLQLEANHVPFLEGALSMARMGIIPKGAYNNRRFLAERIWFDQGVPQDLISCLFDPQTSGGLLISVESNKVDELLNELEICPTKFAKIGVVKERQACLIEVK